MSFTESDNLLLQALRRLLKPIVRLCIRRNVTLQVYVGILKELYVSDAENNLKAAGVRVTDSQISLMTGVHRRDVREYRGRSPEQGRDMPQVSVGAEVVARWVARPDYVDAQGQPRALPYAAGEGVAHSFSSLAESVSKDVRPRAILDELLRQDIARHDELTGEVSLKTEAFVPQDGWAEKLYYLARNGEDHLDAAVTNVLSVKPPFLDRSVYHDELTRVSVEELDKMARDGSMRVLRAINRRAYELSTHDKGKPGAKHRMTFGAYFFTDAAKDLE